MAERAQMRGGQIADMDVVADRGAVAGRIIRAVDLDRVAAAERGAQHQRDQVGFRLVILADAAVGRGAAGANATPGDDDIGRGSFRGKAVASV